MISFRSKITKRVLSYLLLNPHAELYLNEMAVKFNVDLGNLARKLNEWEREAIVEKRKRGNLSLYRVNKAHPLYRELRAITEKQFGLEEALRSALKQVVGVKQAYIFGSYAAGNLGSESDIDVLAVGSHKAVDVQRRLVTVQKKFDREINVVDMTEMELVRRKKARDPLVARIFGGPNIKLL
ncbi:MAG: nucleotidyltransferase domain-containing protein [Patescibacteria group bacterium]